MSIDTIANTTADTAPKSASERYENVRKYMDELLQATVDHGDKAGEAWVKGTIEATKMTWAMMDAMEISEDERHEFVNYLSQDLAKTIIKLLLGIDPRK